MEWNVPYPSFQGTFASWRIGLLILIRIGLICFLGLKVGLMGGI